MLSWNHERRACTRAGDASVSRADGFLRFLELKDCMKSITCRDQGFGDGSKRAALISSYKINGGEGPGADGGGVDVAKVPCQ